MMKWLSNFLKSRREARMLDSFAEIVADTPKSRAWFERNIEQALADRKRQRLQGYARPYKRRAG